MFFLYNFFAVASDAEPATASTPTASELGIAWRFYGERAKLIALFSKVEEKAQRQGTVIKQKAEDLRKMDDVSKFDSAFEVLPDQQGDGGSQKVGKFMGVDLFDNIRALTTADDSHVDQEAPKACEFLKMKFPEFSFDANPQSQERWKLGGKAWVDAFKRFRMKAVDELKTNVAVDAIECVAKDLLALFAAPNIGTFSIALNEMLKMHIELKVPSNGPQKAVAELRKRFFREDSALEISTLKGVINTVSCATFCGIPCK
ncbi:MAG: hypothetical protein H6850_00435 [Alphaproteobacteria bacterium]|nr:MAG: hypothetical protein H6850_00435 [Alphaproteobacteria bacterium]